MFIHFFCLCPPGLSIKLNINISKLVYHTTPGKFENSVFTQKAHRMFSVHTMSQEFKNATVTGHFGFVFEENHVIIVTSSLFFEKLRFQNVFRPQ